MQSTWTVKSTSSGMWKQEQTGVIRPYICGSPTWLNVKFQLNYHPAFSPFNPFKGSWIILMEQISSSTTILMQNPKQSLPLFNFLWCKIHLKQSLSLFHRLWCKLKQSLSLFNFMLCKSFKTLKLSLALEQNFLISVSPILSCKRLGLWLEKEKHQSFQKWRVTILWDYEKFRNLIFPSWLCA